MGSKTGQWQLVEDRLGQEIASGVLAPGARLPTETAIMERFSVGRHSVRRAIAELAAAGKVRVEQGRGTFVDDHAIISYAIAQRTRFSRNLIDQGRVPSGQPVDETELPAPPVVAAALRIPEGEPVYMIVRRGFADDVPINLGHSYHPVARFPNMPLRRRSGRSLTAIYAEYGIDDYLRSTTTILTRLPLAEEARQLSQPLHHPVMIVQKTDVDMDGRPIAYSEVAWAGERVQFTIDGGAAAVAGRQMRQDEEIEA